MSLFDNDSTFDLFPDELAIATRPIVGNGGAQGLLQKLLQCHRGAGRFADVPDELLGKAYRYAYRYDSGGFQDRFRAVIRAALRAGWKPPDDHGVSAGTSAPFGRHRG